MGVIFREDWSRSGWTCSQDQTKQWTDNGSADGTLNPDSSLPSPPAGDRPISPANHSQCVRVVSNTAGNTGSEYNYAFFDFTSLPDVSSMTQIWVSFYANIWSHSLGVGSDENGFHFGHTLAPDGTQVNRIVAVLSQDSSGATPQLGVKSQICDPSTGNPSVQPDWFAWIETGKWYRYQYMYDLDNLKWEFRVYDVLDHAIVRISTGDLPSGSNGKAVGRVFAGIGALEAAPITMYQGITEVSDSGFTPPEIDRPTRIYRPFIEAGLGRGWKFAGPGITDPETDPLPMSALDKGSGEDYYIYSDWDWENAPSDELAPRQGFIWRINDEMTGLNILAARWRHKAKYYDENHRNFMLQTSFEEHDQGREHYTYGFERGGFYISSGPNVELYTYELFENPHTELPWDAADWDYDTDSSGMTEGERCNGVIGTVQGVNSNNPSQPQYSGGIITEWWMELIVTDPSASQSYLIEGPRFGGVTDSTIKVWVRCLAAARVRIMYGLNETDVKRAEPQPGGGTDTTGVYITDDPSSNNAVSDNGFAVTIDLAASTSAVNSLTPDSTYYIDVYIDGNSTYTMERDSNIPDWNTLWRCQTFPTEGTWADFDFIVAGDKHDAAENFQIYHSMRDLRLAEDSSGTSVVPRLYFDLGDEHSVDSDVMEVQDKAWDEHNQFFRMYSQRLGYKYRRGFNCFNRHFAENVEKRLPIARIWSDHDFADDNVTKTGWVPRANITDGEAAYWRVVLDGNDDTYQLELIKSNNRFGGKSTLGIYTWSFNVYSVDSVEDIGEDICRVTFTYETVQGTPADGDRIGWNGSENFGIIESVNMNSHVVVMKTETMPDSSGAGIPGEGDIIRGGGRIHGLSVNGFAIQISDSANGNDGYYRGETAYINYGGPTIFTLGHPIATDEMPVSSGNGITADFYVFRHYNCFKGFKEATPNYEYAQPVQFIEGQDRDGYASSYLGAHNARYRQVRSPGPWAERQLEMGDVLLAECFYSCNYETVYDEQEGNGVGWAHGRTLLNNFVELGDGAIYHDGATGTVWFLEIIKVDKSSNYLEFRTSSHFTVGSSSYWTAHDTPDLHPVFVDGINIEDDQDYAGGYTYYNWWFKNISNVQRMSNVSEYTIVDLLKDYSYDTKTNWVVVQPNEYTFNTIYDRIPNPAWWALKSDEYERYRTYDLKGLPKYGKFGIRPGHVAYISHSLWDTRAEDDQVRFALVQSNDMEVDWEALYDTRLELTDIRPGNDKILSGPIIELGDSDTLYQPDYKIKVGSLHYSFKYGDAEFFVLDVCSKGDPHDLRDPYGDYTIRRKGVSGAPTPLYPGVPGHDRLDGLRWGAPPKVTGTVDAYMQYYLVETTYDLSGGSTWGGTYYRTDNAVFPGDVVRNVNEDTWAVVESVSEDGHYLKLADRMYNGNPIDLFTDPAAAIYEIYESGGTDHSYGELPDTHRILYNKKHGHTQREWLIESVNNSTAQWKFIMCQDPFHGVRPWDYNEHWDTVDPFNVQRDYIMHYLDATNVVYFGADQHFAGLCDGQRSTGDVTFPCVNASPLYSEWATSMTHAPMDENSWLVDGKYAAWGRDFANNVNNWGAYAVVEATAANLTISIRGTDGDVIDNSPMVLEHGVSENLGDLIMTIGNATFGNSHYNTGHKSITAVYDTGFTTTANLIAELVLTLSASWNGEFVTSAIFTIMGFEVYLAGSWTGNFGTTSNLYRAVPIIINPSSMIPDEVFDMSMSFTSVADIVNKYIGKFDRHWDKSGDDAFQNTVVRTNTDSVSNYGKTWEENFEMPWVRSEPMAKEVLDFWTGFKGEERITLQMDIMWQSLDIEIGSYITLDSEALGDTLSLLDAFQTEGDIVFLVVAKTYDWATERRVLTLVQIR